MALARLRRIGGSVMVAIPPAMLHDVRLTAKSAVEVTLDREAGTLSIRPARPRYTLDQLLEERGDDPDPTPREWIDDAPVGLEDI